MSTILQLKNLSKTYRRAHLWRVQKTIGVENFSLDIQSGEIFGLLGLNGAGKTTTLKLILGLLFPDQGEIVFNGKKMPDSEAARQIGFLPEVPYFPRYLSVQEVVRFYGCLSGLSAQEIAAKTDRILELLRMIPNKNKKIKECSKGMMQRVSLAQALIHDPNFLVLDEPITGLDPLGLTEMRDIILNLNSQGKTILFSSHMIAEVSRIAHRVAILAQGRLVKVLSASDWEKHPGGLEQIFVDVVRREGDPAIV